jgi:class 3 adenylate cyclase
VRETEVRFAVRDGASLAFEVFGNGPSDIIIVKDNFPIDLMWDLPQLAAFMDRLGSFARVIAFDDRGSAASDPVPSGESVGLDMWCDDLIAVLDAADSSEATVFDIGGPTGIMAAATYPSRIRSLVLFHLRASFPEFRSLPLDTLITLGRARSTRESLREENPRLAHDPVLQQWWGRAIRLQSSPAATARLMELAGQMDVGPVLPDVRVPTLVFHRRDNRRWNIEISRSAAAKIPDARFVELPGAEESFFLGETASMLDEIERFVGEDRPALDDDRALATVLFTDIVASTERLAAVGDRAWREMLDTHDGIVDREVVAHRGQVVKRLGDGVLATFDGPARAVRCAMAVRERVADRGIHVRGGLHTGEVEWRQGDVAGIAVHIASRVAALAGPDEILATRTLVDLTAGSGISFDARGHHELKGVPGVWDVFAAS